MTAVVIVGSGPTGATLALLLVQRGIPVKLVEASSNFRRVFRGEGLMPSGLEALEQMGLAPLLEQVPYRCVDAWEFWIDQRSLFQVKEPLLGDRKPALISQPALLEALLNQSQQYPGFEFVQGSPVQNLLWQDGRVAGVKLSDRDIPATLVIGADGRNSIVRQKANLAIAHQSQAFNVLWFRMADGSAFSDSNVFYAIARGRNTFGMFRSSEGNLQIGWTVQGDEPTDWKTVDWAERFANAVPSHLAEHFREYKDTLERPVSLSVVVGRCPQWSAPGVLLLGDAAHPMSPIRAQGINMALRDVIVAVNHLVPALALTDTIDLVLPQIQAEREPEILRAQALQAEEEAQAVRLSSSAVLRWVASRFAPVIRDRIQQSWIKRQQALRQGVTQVQLLV